MARKYEALLESAEPDLALYLDKVESPDADIEEVSSKYRKRRTIENYDSIVVGHRLRDERLMSGLTQREVAAALGVTYQTICLWETGKVDLTLRDAHRLMMLYRRIPGNRTDDQQANLNDLTWTPMEWLAVGDWKKNIA
jgi:DNA-binding XRE family transcriptional regulator